MKYRPIQLIYMRLYLPLFIFIAIMVLAPAINCDETAYTIGPNGKIAVGYANITEKSTDNIVSFTVSAPPNSAKGASKNYKTSRDINDIIDEISMKVNRGNGLVRDRGLDLVGNISGPQRIDQICSIYDYMVGKWTYVSDWKGLDEFQYSNYTLQKGISVGSSGKGDCDDFAILLAALIESIGGTPRIVFGYSPTGGHAYTEVYLGKENDRDINRMVRWLRTTYKVDNISIHEDSGNGDVWLNMDWWKEPGGAYYPGGPFYHATYQKPMYIRADEDKTSLTPIENMLPVASFNWTPLRTEVDQTVSFLAAQSYDPDGKILNYEWDFGDGGSDKGATKSACRHIYLESGKFPVNLTVTDNEGDITYKTIEIIVDEPRPDAIFTYSPAEPAVGDIITFDASKSHDKTGSITKYSWNFDDGYSGERVIIKHQYFDSGTYNVSLTVENDKGAKNSSPIKVNVVQKTPIGPVIDYFAAKPPNIGEGKSVTDEPGKVNISTFEAKRQISPQAITPESAEDMVQIAIWDENQPNQIAWSPDGKQLAIASYKIRSYAVEGVKNNHLQNNDQNRDNYSE